MQHVMLNETFRLLCNEYGVEAMPRLFNMFILDMTNLLPTYWERYIKDRGLENQWEATVKIPHPVLNMALKKYSAVSGLSYYLTQPYYKFRNDDEVFASIHKQMVLNDFMSSETSPALIELKDIQMFFEYATDKEYYVYDVDGKQTDRRLDFEFINDIKQSLIWDIYFNVPKGSPKR